MKEHYSLETQYLIAAQTIKTAILQSQYQAVKLKNFPIEELKKLL